MDEAICPVCGESFKPSVGHQVYCPGEAGKRSRCKRQGDNARHRAQSEQATCKGCGQEFARTRGRDNRVYCSDECHARAKAERYAGLYTQRCEHGVRTNGAGCPACTFLRRAEASRAWRKVLRADPCAYCGKNPCSGIDHIDPKVEDRSDHGNWTGCCKECNQLKQVLPMVVSLPWIPVAREYHRTRRLLFSPPGGD